MTRPRFLAVIGRASAAGMPTLEAALRARGFEAAVKAARFRAWTPAGSMHLTGRDGELAVFGAAYARSQASLISRRWNAGDLEPETGHVGERLMRDGWGDWVSISRDARTDALEIARAPSVASGCYYALRDVGLWVTSDADLLWELGIVSGAIDWHEIAASLVYPALRGRATAMHGIAELLPGTALYWDGRPSSPRTLWSPWEFTRSGPGAFDHARAAVELRNTVNSVVATLMSRTSASVLSVSGGLDSSIVAAAAVAVGCRPQLITMATSDAAGDERPFARIVSAHLKLPLHERSEDMGRVRLRESCARHLPRPAGRAFSQSLDRAVFDLAREIGASAYFHGGGGDNVFCMLNSVLPAVDRLRAEGPGSGTLATIGDVARIAQHSWADTAWRTVRRAIAGTRSYSPPGQILFLPPELARCVEVPDHPWLRAPAGALPGKVLHIAWILGIQAFLEGHAHEREITWHAPLLAQPVVEACLRIPTWAWCEGGRNRAVARDAYADRLPAAIIERQSKGTPTSFLFQLLEANDQEMRELLLEGHLARSGLVNRHEIERALNGRNLRSGEALRLMQLADVEAWLASRPAPRAA